MQELKITSGTSDRRLRIIVIQFIFYLVSHDLIMRIPSFERAKHFIRMLQRKFETLTNEKKYRKYF
jgi:hypothetical protein